MPLADYLALCREDVITEIQRIIPDDGRYGSILYDLMLDYPMRAAKGLRPALSIATCRALGGKLDAVLRSAAVLELYHNAFLIHDDIEDESELRRGGPTLHREVGVPVAVNVGDAMLCLSLQPLLDNTAVIGLGPSLAILKAVARMTRESVEGQALELDWVRRGIWQLEDADYVRMVEQKTGWYSFITPIRVGALAAHAAPGVGDQLAEFARLLSVAFQIQDDLLNLDGEVGAYGKEIGGDLWEGKRTLMLIHALRTCTDSERAEALRILSLPRPSPESESHTALLAELQRDGHLSAEGLDALQRAGALTTGRATKTEADVRWLFELLARQQSLDYARAVATQWAGEAADQFAICARTIPKSPHRQVLEDLIAYVHERTQ